MSLLASSPPKAAHNGVMTVSFQARKKLPHTSIVFRLGQISVLHQHVSSHSPFPYHPNPPQAHHTHPASPIYSPKAIISCHLELSLDPRSSLLSEDVEVAGVRRRVAAARGADGVAGEAPRAQDRRVRVERGELGAGAGPVLLSTTLASDPFSS